MAKRLDWEKAKRNEKKRNRPNGSERRRKKMQAARQQALDKFVQEHMLTCFKCHAIHAEWAKTGFSKRGPWAICANCVNKR